MNKRFLPVCGLIAPVLFVFTAILGAAIRPDYSHRFNTVSELFSPGSPNKPLLDSLHLTFAVLLTLFGIGMLQLARRQAGLARGGVAGAWIFILMGCLSVLTATVFPQDAWGTPATFAGQMHQVIGGVIGLTGMFSMLLFGTWLQRAGLFPHFGAYSLITVLAVVLSTAFFMASWAGPNMGAAERVTILVGFQWTFVLAFWMVSRGGPAPSRLATGMS